MGWLITTMRRALLLVMFGALAGGVWVWWRDRRAASAPVDPPEWPPLTTVGGRTAGTPVPTDAVSTSISTPDEGREAPAEAASSTSNSPPADESTSSASIVNALVDAPDARSDPSSGNWVAPLADGTCPPTHLIKANDNSGIYHVPGGRFYDRTKAERCYTTEAAASADGYRPAKA